jgi:histidine triad (HIT) family protein
MCVFCTIVDKKIPASVVYEDDTTLAFMDLHQVAPGHVLIIPKQHFETIDQLPTEIAAAIFPVVVLLAKAVKSAFCPDGLTIVQSNGKAAMQEVPHVHIHIMPRYYHDGVLHFYTKGVPETSKRIDLDAWAAKIRAQIV